MAGFIGTGTAALRVHSNQRRILRAAQTTPTIQLVPAPPGPTDDGVQYYYHFVFDCWLPLFLLITNSALDVVFVLERRGPFLDRLPDIFPNRVRIVEQLDLSAHGAPVMELAGMDPTCVRVRPQDLERFKDSACRVLGVDQSAPATKVLLIERLAPAAYYQASNQTSGTSRRSIQNHQALRAAVQSLTGEDFTFHNVALEELSTAEQVRLFSQAAVVVGQHGAGLANTVWMHRNATVVELNHDPVEKNHFQIVSRLKGHSHLTYRTEGAQVDIDGAAFYAWMAAQPALARFARKSQSGQLAAGPITGRGAPRFDMDKQQALR